MSIQKQSSQERDDLDWQSTTWIVKRVFAKTVLLTQQQKVSDHHTREDATATKATELLLKAISIRTES